jgi:hypothetical protein
MPNLNDISPIDLVSEKQSLKSEHGIFELEEYMKDDEELYKITLRLKDLPKQVAEQAVLAVRPFFENPENPQLSLKLEVAKDEL